MSDHFTYIAKREGFPIGAPVEYDYSQYQHQVPGGMISNLRFQLRKVGMENKIDQALEETMQVRAELGYPIMVTPLSQFVGSQAAINVIVGERYKEVTDQIIQYALGYWGKEGAELMAPEVKAKILDRPRAKEWAGRQPPEPIGRRAAQKDERGECLRRRVSPALESRASKEIEDHARRRRAQGISHRAPAAGEIDRRAQPSARTTARSSSKKAKWSFRCNRDAASIITATVATRRVLPSDVTNTHPRARLTIKTWTASFSPPAPSPLSSPSPWAPSAPTRSKRKISAEMLNIFEVGVRYQMYHALGLFAVAWAITRWPESNLNAAGWCFIVGIVIFSGSLYLLSFTGMRWLGAITPIGGLAFLIGWAILIWSLIDTRLKWSNGVLE